MRDLMKYLVYIVGIFLVFQGCVKEDDVLPPNVTFQLPLENSVFNVPDTIQVRANINSEHLIESVDVRIVDQNYVPRSETTQVNPNSTSYELNKFVIVNDKYLESDNYFIEIIARASGETKRKYLQIVLNEYPLEYQKLVTVHENGSIDLIAGVLDTVQFEIFDMGGMT